MKSGATTPLRCPRMNVIDVALNAASDVSRIDRKTLLADCRVAYVCRARHAAFLVAYEHGASFHRIGKRLSRNHTTVKHGVARARHFIANDTDYAAFVERVRECAAA